MNMTRDNDTRNKEAWSKLREYHSKAKIKRPNVLIMGQSGAGKTRSICNLPPKETIILLTEKSALTFPNAKAFYEAGNVIECREYNDVMRVLFKESMRDDINYFAVDSFTGLWQMALRSANESYSGFAVWDRFAKLVQDFLLLISELRQCVFVIAHSEKISAGDTDDEYEVEVVIEGKKLKKIPISSQFELCLFAKKLYETDDSVKYVFYTNALRHTSAKSPEGMMPRIVDNDLNLVANAIKEFYK